MPRIRKIALEIRKHTSHVVTIPRYEVPVRRAVNAPDTKLAIHPIPNPSPQDVLEVGDWRDEFQRVRQLYGADVVGRAYADAEAFRLDFEATVKRDNADVAVPELDTVEDDWIPLVEIDGIGDDLAKLLYESGKQSVYAVAAATLDELEGISGIGPATAVRIQNSARELCSYEPTAETDPLEVQGLDPLAGQPVPDTD